MALNEEVNATKMHQSRLGELEAELARLEGLHGAADAAHKDHLSRLEPLRTRHRSLQVLLGTVLDWCPPCCQGLVCLHAPSVCRCPPGPRADVCFARVGSTTILAACFAVDDGF